MFDEKTLVKLNGLSERCEDLSKILEEYYKYLLEELDNIYAEVDDILHNKEPDNSKKKANIVFDGDQWCIETKNGINSYDTFNGYPKNYVDDNIINMIEVLTSQGYEFSFEYKIKGE